MTILHHLVNKRKQEPMIRRRRRSPFDMGYDYKKHLEKYEKEEAKVEKIRNEIIYMVRGLRKSWLLRVH